MRAWRYWIGAAAIGSVSLVVPAGASAPQQATMPIVVPPPQPATTRPIVPNPYQPAELPPPRSGQAQGSWDRMGMRGFSVSLVVGDLTGASTADNLPAGAKKALADMKDFLPYKSYRLLDTHWILCCSSSSQASVSGRLRGAEEDDYSFSIHVKPVNDWSELGITFSLADLGGNADHAQTVSNVLSSNERSRRMSELLRERAELQRRHDELERKLRDSHPDRMKLRAELENKARQIRELEQSVSSTRTTSRRDTRPVLDSTFSMKVGETVVIGTSRLKGDKALIALLTAASRNAVPPRESRN